MSELLGYRSLQARLDAIGDGKGRMGLVASNVVGHLRKNIPRKTSGTSRTIRIVSVTETSARIEGSAVARYLDEGTGLFGPKHRRITSPSGKVLRWTGGPAGSLTLAGRKRSGKAGRGAGNVFARSTKGMKGRPFVARSVTAAGDEAGVKLTAQIVDTWNSGG